ncbi:MAG TPA: metallophosphoesterase [Chitinophagales bacterium]|nr:metallophosphoesterase [Chitinophagales bacterium]
MFKQDRKTFLRTLGLMGAGAMFINGAPIEQSSPSDTPPRTEPLPQKGAKRLLRVAHLTDIHVKSDRIAEYGMAAALHAVNGMDDKPDFILSGGDAIMNAAALTKGNIQSQWDTFNSILKSDNSLPIYHCIGNHDLFGWMLPSPDHADGKKWAMDEYGMRKSYYSFTLNGWHFIVLDSIHGRNSVPGYYGKLDEAQMDWLKGELKNTPASTHICVVSHIPIMAICCLFDRDITNREPMKISDSDMHADWNELVETFYARGNVRACLSGHIHLIDYVNYLGTEYYCNGAVAGGWWKGDHQHFAPSYSMMNFYEDGSTSREVHYYKWKA